MDNQLVPINEIKQAAQMMCKLFGKTESDLAALMLIAHAEGKPIALAATEYDIIQGKPALNSRAAQARFQLSGGKIQWTTTTETECVGVFNHPSGGQLTIKWDMKRAALAGLSTKDSWKKYPAQMLRARCIAEGIRAVYPACLNQLYLVEEIQDFDTPKNERKQAEKATLFENPVETPACLETKQEPMQDKKLEVAPNTTSEVTLQMMKNEIKSKIGDNVISIDAVNSFLKSINWGNNIDEVSPSNVRNIFERMDAFLQKAGVK
jgi:hypothetical protein